MSGQTVAWQAGRRYRGSGRSRGICGANGIDSKTLSVGSLAEGQQATATACLNGTSQCAKFTALGARPEYATLETLSGTAPERVHVRNAGPDRMRVRDMNGNPMAAGR